MFDVDMYVLTCLRHAKAAPAVLEVRSSRLRAGVH